MNTQSLQHKIQTLLPNQEVRVDDYGYLKVNYWESLSNDEIDAINFSLGVELEEEEFDDEDCGKLHTYKIWRNKNIDN